VRPDLVCTCSTRPGATFAQTRRNCVPHFTQTRIRTDVIYHANYGPGSDLCDFFDI
jgi:hypothetical protein